MGLALTACANSNATSQAPEAKAMPKAHAHHHKADMKGANPHAHMKMDSHAHKHMDMMAHHHFDKLDLTDAQKKQIDALKQQLKMYEGHKKMDLEKHHPKMKEHHHHQKMETKKPEKPAPKADVPKPVK